MKRTFRRSAFQLRMHPTVGNATKGVTFRDGDRFVNLRAIVELSALISAHSPNLIETGMEFPLDALQRYWSCSRAQSRLWMARLGDFPAGIASASPQRREMLWQRTKPILADVLAGDLVARVWGAVLSANDCARGETRGAPIAKSVLAQHEAARHRALRILAESPWLTLDELAPLDRLRRRLERWTDVLIGHLARRYGVVEFAFDAERARDFGEEQLQDSWNSGALQVWDLYFVCLRTALPEAVLPGGRLAELREEIARTMLSTFPQEAFLDTGMMKSVRMRRLLGGTERSETAPHKGPRRLSRGL